MAGSDFRTFQTYAAHPETELSASMEDYLEMIARLFRDEAEVRISRLAQRLAVQPSSATKMVQKLHELGYVNARRYQTITLTPKGREASDYLLKRHQSIYDLLSLVQLAEDRRLAETEKLEHMISRETLQYLISLTAFFEECPECRKRYGDFLQKKGRG